jgi:hypothetical protein
MQLPVITDTIRTSVEGLTNQGHKWANVLHFRKTGAITYAAAIAILDPILLSHYTVSSGGGSTWKNNAPTVSSLTGFRYLPLDGTSAATVITHAVAGADAGDPLPPSVCQVVTLRTATRGRSYRGRVYQGPWTEPGNVAGAPVAATTANIAIQWTRLITTALPGSGVSLVVASYHLALATDVTSVTVDSRWDTQRRRLNV